MSPVRSAAGFVVSVWRFFRRPRVFDTALVVVLVVGSVLGMVVSLIQGAADVATGTAFFMVTSLPLLVRRDHPLAAAAGVAVLEVFGMSVGVISSYGVPMVIALYSVGRYTSGRKTVFATVGAAVAYATVFELTSTASRVWLQMVVSALIFVGTGQLFRVRAELRLRNQREAAEAAVRAERRRIARELHDVVAHHLSVINALVGGARATLPPGHDVTREALSSAEGTAREALAEMRRLLDVLRADGGSDAGADGASTGVGAARLPALVEEARSAGLPTTLTVAGQAVPLPAAVDHAVYRIVQESLTNARKHAAGARAEVLVAYRPEAVEVEVVDDGASSNPKPSGEPGFGLSGMAERVALCGGELSTGPRPEGGFRVHARLPLETT